MTPIKLHHLRPAPGAKTEKIRVGRGEGSKGKTAGRGTKGRRLARTCRPVSRAARCRSTCACRS
ncbi:50S ribosomal protein L15 [Nocardia africana]|uniref:50S ribosomal protein L15 n=1 Tax=Nocardia africana TaxID=134964 RepID=A0A378WN67_9NOCA|nr:50S ribosomal protein L15 [Nocardia africana]